MRAPQSGTSPILDDMFEMKHLIIIYLVCHVYSFVPLLACNQLLLRYQVCVRAHHAIFQCLSYMLFSLEYPLSSPDS